MIIRLRVDDDALVERIVTRFEQEGRPDDNPESFKKRLGAYNEQTAPLLPIYAEQGKLREIDGMQSIENCINRDRQDPRQHLGVEKRRGYTSIS